MAVRALLGACLAVVFAIPSRAQDAVRSRVAGGAVAAAHRIGPGAAPGMRLDGRLDEAFWRDAVPLGSFRQREPREGEPATEETEVRIAYDADNLLLAVDARDTHPAGPVARILERDRLLVPGMPSGLDYAGDDVVVIVLDPSHDHRNAVILATNPNGAEFDALVTDEGREINTSWRGNWQVAARRTATGWSAEFRIPFRTLRATGTDGVWGLNVARLIRRENEEVLWTGWRRGTEGLLRISAAGHLTGVTEVPRQGLDLEVKPFVLGSGDAERPEEGGTVRSQGAEIGLDLKYEVRPGLVLDGTLNTDFAQAEVDDEQVNLTRFDLFLPEKREFFLENAGIFEFGQQVTGTSPAFLMFFSRRIGVADSGAVPVRSGLRLTGRAGRQTLGLLNVLTRGAWDEPASDFSVARVKRDVGSTGYVGAMLTDRRWNGGHNTAGGADFSLWPSRNLNIQGLAVRTETSGPGGDDGAYGLRVNYRTSRVDLDIGHLSIGPDVEARSGFVRRTDVRQTAGYGYWLLRPGLPQVRTVTLGAHGTHVVRSDGELVDWDAGSWVQVNSNAGDMLVLYHSRSFTLLDEAFDLADSVPVPVGGYRNTISNLYVATSTARPVATNGYLSKQRFFGGRMASVGAELRLALGSHVSLIAAWDRNDADLPGGSFVADVTRLRMSYAVTTRLFANALVQYNSLERRASANLRLHWMYRPGSDVFVVLNEERGSDISAWAFASRGLRLKVTYQRLL